MMYWVYYILMLVGFAGVSFNAPDLKGKIIGALIFLINAILFWK